jgi:hypothetical protein
MDLFCLSHAFRSRFVALQCSPRLGWKICLSWVPYHLFPVLLHSQNLYCLVAPVISNTGGILASIGMILSISQMIFGLGGERRVIYHTHLTPITNPSFRRCLLYDNASGSGRKDGFCPRRAHTLALTVDVSLSLCTLVTCLLNEGKNENPAL